MYEYKITKVLKVVDGDTVDVILDLGFDMFKKERVRLAGIDTPESRTKDLEEKELGIDAKEFLERRMMECEELWVQPKRMENTGECWGRFGALQRASMRKWFIGGMHGSMTAAKKKKI